MGLWQVTRKDELPKRKRSAKGWQLKVVAEPSAVEPKLEILAPCK